MIPVAIRNRGIDLYQLRTDRCAYTLNIYVSISELQSSGLKMTGQDDARLKVAGEKAENMHEPLQ